MIDVMMFLLVFFVLISLNVIPALGLKTNLPGSSQTEKLVVRKHLIITVGASGQLQIDGIEIKINQLPTKLKQLKQLSDVDVVINSDKDVSVQKLVDVMDSIKSSGITAVAISSMKKS
jgi:biopolymer transport protein ExbD